jgi:hypothetical protein
VRGAEAVGRPEKLAQEETEGLLEWVTLPEGDNEKPGLPVTVTREDKEEEKVGLPLTVALANCEGENAGLPVTLKLCDADSDELPLALAVQLTGAIALGKGQQGQGKQAAAPAEGPYVPAVQLTQVALEKAPVAFEKVPGGHAKGAPTKAGQKYPSGHTKEPPPVQYEPAAHARQVSWRMRLFTDSAANRTPVGEAARNTMVLNVAVSPKPSPNEAIPVPATVLTRVVTRSTDRTRFPEASATYSVENDASRATPRGELSAAAVPAPFAPPATPVPTKEVTFAVVMFTLRTRWFDESPTNRTPLGCQAALVGRSSALVPTPSAKPATLPTSADTAPVASCTLRTVPPACSTT